MTAFTINASKNYDSLPGGSVNATLDTYAIANDAVLTIDTDTRYCSSHTGASGSLDTVTITAGTVRVDGTGIKMIPYKSGSGTLPTLYTALATTAASWSGSVATITTATHSLTTGDWVHIGGIVGATINDGYCGLFQITVTSTTQFTYELAVNPGTATITNGHAVKYFTISQNLSTAKNITGASYTGTTVTITSNSHGFANGDWVTISGVTPATYNGTWQISNVQTNTFDFTKLVSPGAFTSGGTATKVVFGFNAASGAWANFVSAPTTTTPATGFLKVKNVRGGSFAAGALTIQGGTTPAATAMGQLTGWIEVVGADTGNCSIPRLGAFEVTGEWFYPQLLPQVTTGLSSSGTTATATFAGAHGITVGDIVTITGATVTGYNGTYTVVSVPLTTSFTFTTSGSNLASDTVSNVLTEVTSSGVRGQQIQLPASLAASYYNGVFVETGVGTGVYRPWVSVGTSTAAATSTVQSSVIGEKVWVSTQGLLRLGQDLSGNSNGVMPVAGCRIRFGNIIFHQATRSAGTGSGANAVPSTTLATRYDFTTTSAGQFSIDKCVFNWYPSLTQAYSVSITNSIVSEQISLVEVATTITLTNMGVGLTGATYFQAFIASLCFAGINMNNCNFLSATPGTTNNRNTNAITDVFNISATDTQWGFWGARGAANQYPMLMTRVNNSTFTNLNFYGGLWSLTTCANINFIGTHYADTMATTVTGTSNPQSAFSITANSLNIKVDGYDHLGLTQHHPYTALFTITVGCQNIKIRNIGTSSTPLDLSTTNGVGYIVTSAAGAGLQNIEVKRVYCSNVRTGITSFDNSISGVLYENVWADTGDTFTISSLNTLAKGIRGTNSVTGQTSTYGHTWQDCFTSTTVGRIILQMNEQTSLLSQYTAVQLANGSGFTSSGTLAVKALNDEIIFETPYKIIGHTSFQNVAPTLTGTNLSGGSAPVYGNITLYYQLDKGSGYGGSWIGLTAANISAETGIDAQAGFKIKIRVVCTTASTTNSITAIRLDTNSSTTAQGYQYVLDTVPVTVTVLDQTTLSPLQNVRIRIVTSVGGNVVLEGLTNASGVLTGTTEYASHAVSGTARRASVEFGTLYKPGSISGTTTSAGFSTTVLLISDE